MSSRARRTFHAANKWFVRLCLPVQEPLTWDLLVILSLMADCCSELDALMGSSTLPLLTATWRGAAALQQTAGGRGGNRGGGRGGRSRGRSAAAAAPVPAALPSAADGQRLHAELVQQVGKQMKGMKRRVNMFVGSLTIQADPPEASAAAGG